MTPKTPNKADLLVYKALKAAIGQDKLRIYLDYGKVNRPQSPVYDPFKKKIYRRLIERTKNYLVSGYENCEKLWAWGGIVLVNADNKTIGCVAPEGDWKDFVVINFADLMVDKNNENKGTEAAEESSAA